MRRVFLNIILLLCITVALSGCSDSVSLSLNKDNIRGQKFTENDVMSLDKNLYLENEYLQLYLNPDTTEITVVNRKNGSVWNSTCRNSDNSVEKSILEISYLDELGTVNSMNSYEHSVLNGQYEIEKSDDKLIIHFSIGNFTDLIRIPEVITEERFRELCSNFEDEFDEMKFRNYYYYFDINSENDDGLSNYAAKYSILKKQSMYVVNDAVLVSSNIKKEFAQIMENAGYTEEMYNEDKKYFSDGKENFFEAGFNIAVEFSLNESSLSVTIPSDSVEMYENYPLTRISLLKYFGSPSREENGWFLLPDGSGSIMNFYNGKGDGHPYIASVYGTGYDMAVNEKTFDLAQTYFPIFGINRDGLAVFAEITGGEAVSDIVAYTGDDTKNAYVGAEFRFKETYTSKLSSGKRESFTTVQKKGFSGNMTVCYNFFDSKDTDYSLMAGFYRDRLFHDSQTASKNVPITIEFIGSIRKQTQKFGISYQEKVPMTTYNDVLDCVSELYDDGLKDLNVRLTGWFGGGISHESVKEISFTKALGSENDFVSMKKGLDRFGAFFYPDADLQYLIGGSAKKSIRLINNALGRTYSFDYASFLSVKDTIPRNINNISEIENQAKAYLNFLESQKISCASLRSIARDLYSDHNEDRPVSRQTAADRTANILKNYYSKNINIMANGANAYALPWINNCVNVELTSNGYDLCDKSVPFVMMVMHGHVDYAGEALNLRGNMTESILRAAQTGAGLYFTVTAENSDALLNSDYSSLYATDYKYFKEKYLDIAKKYQNDFRILSGEKIVSFRFLPDEVTETTFENGAKVFVNFGTANAVVNGVDIMAKSYVVTGG